MEDSAFAMCFVIICMKWITDNPKCKCTTAALNTKFTWQILPL